MKIYSVYDSKVEAFMGLFVLKTKGEAIRAFGESANDPKTNFYKYGADYTLFEIGEYDEIKGEVKPHQAKINLGTALELRNPEPELVRFPSGEGRSPNREERRAQQ